MERSGACSDPRCSTHDYRVEVSHSSHLFFFFFFVPLLVPAEPQLINIFNFILFNYTEVYCFRRADALFDPPSPQFFRAKLRTKPMGESLGGGVGGGGVLTGARNAVL